MSDHIRIRKAGGNWTIRAEGAVLGESRNALELTEGDRPAVIYFPREDIAMVMMDRSATRSSCPWKGEATHYSLVTGSGTIHDAGRIAGVVDVIDRLDVRMRLDADRVEAGEFAHLFGQRRGDFRRPGDQARDAPGFGGVGRGDDQAVALAGDD